jgi:predicted DNA-binding protein
MTVRSLAIGIAAIVFTLHTPAMSAIYTIDNPADKIKNPANKIYNPASKINNPASNIYNPASRMDNPNPLSPPTQPVPATPPVEQVKEQLKTQPRLMVPHKSYHFKTVKAYINEAKKAFIKDNYFEFLSITEDALRRINAGKLKASEKEKQKLEKYKHFGYGLLEKEKE